MKCHINLDWFLFGNGNGMASPYFDDVFYWLDGCFYQWVGGLGAQLRSYEWFAPKAGTRRKLFGNDFVVFQTHRKWLRVGVSWKLARHFEDYEEIQKLHEQLLKWGHGR